jgi:aspartyl protease family protein
MFLHFLSGVLIGVTEMGLVWVDAVIRSPFTGRAVAVKALVDTGATHTVVSRRVAEELQLPVIGRRRAATAKGLTELDECLGVVEIMGRKAYTHILVSDDVDVVLLGAVTLETLGFEVDSVTGKLKEAKTYLL